MMHARIFHPRKKLRRLKSQAAAAAAFLDGQSRRHFRCCVSLHLTANQRLPAADANEFPLPCRTDCTCNLKGPSPFASPKPKLRFLLVALSQPSVNHTRFAGLRSRIFGSSKECVGRP